MIKRVLFSFCICLLLSSNLIAQGGVSGIWEGTLTQGEETFKVKLELKKKGRHLEGSSLVILSDTSYIELQLNGLYHADRSMNVYEVQIRFPEEHKTDGPIFMRTYQLLYSRSFNDYHLEGWWQEEEKSATDETRRFGRIYLQKVLVNSKA